MWHSARIPARSDNIDITVQGHCCSGNLCNQIKPVKPVQPSESIHPAYGGKDLKDLFLKYEVCDTIIFNFH